MTEPSASPTVSPDKPEPGASPKGPLRWLKRLLSGKGKPRVALVRLSGVIAEGGGGVGRGSRINLANCEDLLTKAFTVKRVQAVALVLNSPGGSPAQSSLIAARIRQLAAEHKVPVIAFVEDMAASGGYWLACAADEIIADPCAILGSIGVITDGFGLHQAIEKIGVERRVYTAGDKKGLLDPFLPENPEDVRRLRHIQGQLHTLFQSWVEERRGDKLDQDKREDLFSGAFWLAPEAQDLGLIDGLGSAAVLLRERFGKDVHIERIEPRKPFFNFSSLGSAAASTALREVLDQVEERALRARLGR